LPKSRAFLAQSSLVCPKAEHFLPRAHLSLTCACVFFKLSVCYTITITIQYGTINVIVSYKNVLTFCHRQIQCI